METEGVLLHAEQAGGRNINTGNKMPEKLRA